MVAGEGGIEGLRWKMPPGIGLVVENEAPELAVVGVDQGEPGGPDQEVLVLRGLVAGRSEIEAAGHPEAPGALVRVPFPSPSLVHPL